MKSQTDALALALERVVELRSEVEGLRKIVKEMVRGLRESLKLLENDECIAEAFTVEPLEAIAGLWEVIAKAEAADGK